jgi:flagellar FliJ protein
MALKSLSTLIKLQKIYVDEQRVHLAALQDNIDAIDGRIAQNEIRKAREIEAARHGEAGQTYGAFMKAMVEEGRVLAKERQAAAMAVKMAQDKLAVLFEEQKRYEVAEEHRVVAEAREENRRENLEFDEIGGVRHERNKKN